MHFPSTWAHIQHLAKCFRFLRCRLCGAQGVELGAIETVGKDGDALGKQKADQMALVVLPKGLSSSCTVSNDTRKDSEDVQSPDHSKDHMPEKGLDSKTEPVTASASKRHTRSEEAELKYLGPAQHFKPRACTPPEPAKPEPTKKCYGCTKTFYSVEAIMAHLESGVCPSGVDLHGMNRLVRVWLALPKVLESKLKYFKHAVLGKSVPYNIRCMACSQQSHTMQGFFAHSELSLCKGAPLTTESLRSFLVDQIQLSVMRKLAAGV